MQRCCSKVLISLRGILYHHRLVFCIFFKMDSILVAYVQLVPLSSWTVSGKKKSLFFPKFYKCCKRKYTKFCYRKLSFSHEFFLEITPVRLSTCFSLFIGKFDLNLRVCWVTPKNVKNQYTLKMVGLTHEFFLFHSLLFILLLRSPRKAPWVVIHVAMQMPWAAVIVTTWVVCGIIKVTMPSILYDFSYP